MHQTVQSFFLWLLVPVATSKSKMNGDDARHRISISFIQYLMLCVALSTPRHEPLNTRTWEPVYFEDYAKYLNRRPFIDYALNHFQLHKDNCGRRHQQRMDDCSQCVKDERLVFQLSEQGCRIRPSGSHQRLALG